MRLERVDWRLSLVLCAAGCAATPASPQHVTVVSSAAPAAIASPPPPDESRTHPSSAPPAPLTAPANPAIAVRAGTNHTCVLLRDATVRCWGDNRLGQLGDGTRTTRATPITPASLDHVLEIAAGGDTSCARRDDGHVLCWGLWGGGPVDGSTTPTQIAGIEQADRIYVGRGIACAGLHRGDLVCWMALPDPGDGSDVDNASTRERRLTLPNAGSVRPVTWGSLSIIGDDGIMRDQVYVEGDQRPARTLTVRDFRPPYNWRDVAVDEVSIGLHHTCAVLRDQTIRCSGENRGGQLGDLTRHDRSGTRVPGIAGASSVTTGLLHTCALTREGLVYCWGTNTWGQLGDGHYDERRMPTLVAAVDAVDEITAGAAHTCARRHDGNVWCWGANDRGQIGIGMPPSGPAVIAGISSPLSVALAGSHGCALTRDHAVSCWGDNLRGESGDILLGDRPIPTPIDGIHDARAIAVSGREVGSTCVLDGGGHVTCVGEAFDEEPMPLDGVENIVAIGASHSSHRYCFVGANGTVRCRRGDELSCDMPAADDAPRTSARAFEVRGLGPVREVAVDFCGACARVDDHVECWGDVEGLGLGRRRHPREPVTVPRLTGVTHVFAGEAYFCALRNDGTVACWGTNDYGQLGDGTGVNSNGPVTVRDVDDAIEIAGTERRACAIERNGTVKCWGWFDEASQSVDPATVHRSPIEVAALRGATHLFAGLQEMCGEFADGSIRCLGPDAHGQLGDRASQSRSTPVIVRWGLGTGSIR